MLSLFDHFFHNFLLFLQTKNQNESPILLACRLIENYHHVDAFGANSVR
jgi:hypothetical protein